MKRPTAIPLDAANIQSLGPDHTVLTTSSGNAVTTPIHALILRRCVADTNNDLRVDLGDYFAFFNCFDASLPCADLDDSGQVDLMDFFLFFNAFDRGC